MAQRKQVGLEEPREGSRKLMGIIWDRKQVRMGQRGSKQWIKWVKGWWKTHKPHKWRI